MNNTNKNIHIDMNKQTNITNTFNITPHIYWINLQSRNDRRELMFKNFKQNGIINHIRITPSTIITPNWKSCLFAHLDAILTAYRDNVEYALICEDDILLDKDAYKKALNDVKLLPEDWDVYQLHYIEPHLLRQLYKRCSTESQPSNRFIRGNFMSCACYLIKRSAMRKLLNTVGYFDDNNNHIFTATLTDYARSELLIYPLLNSYFPLYPYFNTFENNTSDIRATDFGRINNKDFNIENEDAIRNLHKVLNKTAKIINGTIIYLPNHLHWLKTDEYADKFLQDILNERKELFCFLHSGLGNRLFQFCSVLGMCAKEAERCINAKNDNTMPTFNILTSSINYQHLTMHGDYIRFLSGYEKNNLSLEKLPSFANNDIDSVLQIHGDELFKYHMISKNHVILRVEPQGAEYEYIDFNTRRNGKYIFKGYLQNERYFKHIRQDILNKWLKEPEYISHIFNTQLATFDWKNTFAIHVRLGDYVGFNKHFVNLDIYYKRALLFIKTIYKNKNLGEPNFIIISEEQSKETIYNVYPCLSGIELVMNYQRNELFDLYFMARCRGVICSNSTFAWWGAWLHRYEEDNDGFNRIVTLPNIWMTDRYHTLAMSGATVLDVTIA
jgi:hypothetical protein